MAKPTLTEQDFQRAAKKLRCEVPAIKAVAEVESRGKGFYASGFPVILFERHIFRKYTQGRYNKTHPHLSGPAGNYGAAGQNQINKFNEAFKLNPIAAMKSCSWGKFQIMGFNYEICGYEDVGSFVDAMKESEGKHLDAFVEFVIGNGLAIHLRTKNWTAFAKGYNGAGYKKNNYDVKMAKAYARHSVASNVPLGTTPVEDTDSTNTPEPSGDTATPPTILDKANQLGDQTNAWVVALEKFGISIPDAKRSLGTIVLTWAKFIFSGVLTVVGIVSDHWELFVIAGLLVVVAYLLWNNSGNRAAMERQGVPEDVIKALVDKKGL